MNTQHLAEAGNSTKGNPVPWKKKIFFKKYQFQAEVKKLA